MVTMPTLANAMISFHTNDEDKDHDTHVTVTVEDFNRVVVARIDNDFGHFDDHSDNGPYGLQILNNSKKEDLSRGHFSIRIDPNGHDTWRFNLFLTLVFSDNSILSGSVNGLELTQDRQQQVFGLQGIMNRIVPI